MFELFVFDIGISADIGKSVARQHWLVKIGAGLVVLAIVLLFNYFPLALAVDLVALALGLIDPVPPQPKVEVEGWVLAILFLSVFHIFGCHLIGAALSWYTAGPLTTWQQSLIAGAISTVSITIAILARLLEIHGPVLVHAFIGFGVCLFVAVWLIRIGQALDHLRRRRRRHRRRSELEIRKWMRELRHK
jgi:hypothetical protein